MKWCNLRGEHLQNAFGTCNMELASRSPVMLASFRTFATLTSQR